MLAGAFIYRHQAQARREHLAKRAAMATADEIIESLAVNGDGCDRSRTR